LERRRRCGFGLYASLGIARDDMAARERQTLRNYTFFDAPVGLLVTLDRRLNTGSFMDLGMFIQNILVAARARAAHLRAGSDCLVPPGGAGPTADRRPGNPRLRHCPGL
jgi:hypothetical protein